MNTGLTDENYKDLARYRQDRAHETLAEIPFLCAQGYYNTATNRLYYACYYAVSALLIKNGHQAQTHNGVIQMFGLHFVKTEKVERRYGKLYNQLFSLRLTGDYNDSYTLSEEDVVPLIEPARKLILRIEQLIQEVSEI